MTTFSDYVWDTIFDSIGKHKNHYLGYDGKKWSWQAYYSGKILFHSKELDGMLPIRNIEILKTSYDFDSLYFHSDDPNIKTMMFSYKRKSPTYYTNYTAKIVFSYIIWERQ